MSDRSTEIAEKYIEEKAKKLEGSVEVYDWLDEYRDEMINLIGLVEFIHSNCNKMSALGVNIHELNYINEQTGNIDLISLKHTKKNLLICSKVLRELSNIEYYSNINLDIREIYFAYLLQMTYNITEFSIQSNRGTCVKDVDDLIPTLNNFKDNLKLCNDSCDYLLDKLPIEKHARSKSVRIITLYDTLKHSSSPIEIFKNYIVKDINRISNYNILTGMGEHITNERKMEHEKI